MDVMRGLIFFFWHPTHFYNKKRDTKQTKARNSIIHQAWAENTTNPITKAAIKSPFLPFFLNIPLRQKSSNWATNKKVNL